MADFVGVGFVSIAHVPERDRLEGAIWKRRRSDVPYDEYAWYDRAGRMDCLSISRTVSLHTYELIVPTNVH